MTIVDNNTNIQRTVPLNYFNTTVLGISESYTFKKIKGLTSMASFDWIYSWSKSLIPITNQMLNGSGAYFSIINDVNLNKKKSFLFNLSYWHIFKGISDLDRNNTYSQLDLSIKYIALNKNLEISLNAHDILKTNTPTYTSYTNNIRIDYINYYDYRDIRLTAIYKFGNKNIKIEKKEFGNEEEKERAR